MKKAVVLFNLDMNVYLASTKKNFKISYDKDYNKAIKFDNEQFALAYLCDIKERLKKLELTDWCTRTFYLIN